MKKHLFLTGANKPVRAVIRNYGRDDFDALIDLQRESFPPPFPQELWWSKEQLTEHVERFPDGAICAEAGGRLVGSMTGLIVDMEHYANAHSWEAITDNGYIRNHDAGGDTLYVVDICVVPEYRKLGVGKWLMQTMYETVVQLRLKRLLGGGRMPGYAKRAGEASPEQYLHNVVEGRWQDPVISFMLRCGRMPVGVAADYLEDEQSLNYAAIMEWRNPFADGNST